MNDSAPLIAATIATLVAVFGYLINSSVNRLTERRRTYADALTALERLKQLPYDIRRRPDSLAETRREMAQKISTALVEVAFYRRWLMLESKSVGPAYNALVTKVRDANIAFRLDALSAAPALEDRQLHVDPVYNYDDRDERDACLDAMRRELRLFRSILRSR